MSDSNLEHSPSFMDAARVREEAQVWRNFRDALADVGKDATEVGLFLSQANEETRAYRQVLTRLGRKDEARAICEKGIGQSEKFGHSGMADDLRLALIGLNE